MIKKLNLVNTICRGEIFLNSYLITKIVIMDDKTFAEMMIYRTNLGIGEAVVVGNYHKDSYIKRINTLRKQGKVSKEDVERMLNEIYAKVVRPFNIKERNETFNSLRNGLS